MHCVYGMVEKSFTPSFSIGKAKRIMELKEATDVVRDSLLDQGVEKPLCDNCKKSDYDKATLAERFCINCEEKLCISCDKTHAKESAHLVVSLSEQKETRKFKESNFCIDHDEEATELYCTCCMEVICSKCLEESHSSHNCSRVEDVADFVSKQTEAEYENLFHIQCHFDKERENFINEKMKVMKTVKEMETEIQKRCDEITEFVYNETKALLNELDKFKNERLEEVEMERRKMEEHAFTFEKFKEYCDRIKSNTNPRYTCEAEGVLRNIVDDLKTRPQVSWKNRLFSVQFSIQKTDIEQVLSSLSAAVGKFTIRCPYKMTQSKAVKLDEKEVHGMARLHDKLYVLANSISIRRLQHPFASVGEIETQEIKSPKDIVACSKTSRLYIHDKGADCIWKVSVPDNRVSRWLDKVKEPNAVSVTSNAELLMLRNSTPVCLDVYNEHAILVHRFRLPATVPSLSNFDETPSGGYIGLGVQSVFTFRRNGSIISQSQLPINFLKCRGSPQRLSLSPYPIFLHCDATYWKDKNTTCSSFLGFHADLGSIRLPKGSNTKHRDPISLPMLREPFALSGESVNLRTPVTSCYLEETKQLLVLEEVVSNQSKTCYLSAYDILPE